MNPVNWFEIPVNDLDKAAKFYGKVLGYELSPQDMGSWKMAWFPMKQGEAGSAGTLMKSEGYVPSKKGTIVYFTVQDIDKTLEKVKQNGGKILMPKKDIGEHGFIAHFEDCEGNRVAVHSK